METRRGSDAEARRMSGLGRCRHFFWLGVAFDAVGATVLFIGIFSDLIFYDLLLYLGSIIIFLSLLWWVFWYTGNIELSPEDTWKRPISMGTLDQHFSFTVNLTNTLSRFRRERRRRLLQDSTDIHSPSFTVQVHNPLAEEDQDQHKVRRKSVRYTDEVEASGREGLGPEPEPEAVKRSERVGPPDPEAGPLGPEARRSSSHVALPKFMPSEVLDQPLSPDIASSKSLTVVPSSSISQPLTVSYSKSLPNSLTSESNPLIAITSASLPGVPLPSSGQPLDTLASDLETVASETLASGVSLNYPLVHVAAVSHFPTAVGSERDFQSHSLDTGSQASQTQGSLTHFTPGTFFQTQPVHPWVAVAGQGFQSLYNTQPFSTSTVVQEIELSPSPLSREPSEGQELTQEVLDAISRLPESESVAPATEAQKSMPHENAPAPTTPNSGHL